MANVGLGGGGGGVAGANGQALVLAQPRTVGLGGGALFGAGAGSQPRVTVAGNLLVQHIHTTTNNNSGVDGETLGVVIALAESKAAAEAEAKAAEAKAEAAKAAEASAKKLTTEAKDEIIDHISKSHRNTQKRVNHVGEAINATVLKSQKKVRKSIDWYHILTWQTKQSCSQLFFKSSILNCWHKRRRRLRAFVLPAARPLPRRRRTRSPRLPPPLRMRTPSPPPSPPPPRSRRLTWKMLSDLRRQGVRCRRMKK